MEQEIVLKLHKSFEEYSHKEGEMEYWYARDLQILLGYTQWRNFELAIEKAKIACEKSKQKVNDHFADVSKMIIIGNGGKRQGFDIKLTRYA